jgi:hypothetical protein
MERQLMAARVVVESVNRSAGHNLIASSKKATANGTMRMSFVL